MNLQSIGLKPNDLLLELSRDGFRELFEKYIEYYHIYKGKRFFAKETAKYIDLLYQKTRDKFLSVTCNDVAFIFEQEINDEGFNKLSVEYLFKSMSIQAKRKQVKQAQQILDKTLESADPLWGTACRLRMYHDPGRKRLQRGDYSFHDVYQAAKQGVNFYDGEPLVK